MRSFIQLLMHARADPLPRLAALVRRQTSDSAGLTLPLEDQLQTVMDLFGQVSKPWLTRLKREPSVLMVSSSCALQGVADLLCSF